jgi:hypothetical protein
MTTTSNAIADKTFNTRFNDLKNKIDENLKNAVGDEAIKKAREDLAKFTKHLNAIVEEAISGLGGQARDDFNKALEELAKNRFKLDTDQPGLPSDQPDS